MRGDSDVLKPSGTQRKKRSINDKSCRRFSDEQIKSLESLFKMENKLEPRKKLEMARELGLQPRQVAIWFQNRRARWKSKQVEQDYTSLKADYDSLSHRLDSLQKEKHALLQQLRDLCSQLKETSKDFDSGSENEDADLELKGDSEQPLEQYMDEDDPGRHIESENANESYENASNFDPSSLLDQSCSNWWDVWSSIS